jgi:trimeric autotransporter adhesin
MFRFFRFANEWPSRKGRMVPGARQERSIAALGKHSRRNRTRRYPALESVEARILLSSVDLKSATAATEAEVFRVNKSTVLITGVAGVGVKGGQAVLTATLTSGGIPLAGKTITFKVRGVRAGTAITDGNGVAMRYLANLRNVNVGTYAQGVGAGFSGDSSHKSTIVHGKLTVSRLPGTVSAITGSGAYDGVGTLAAALTSRGAAVAGQTIQFAVMGQVVGSAVTSNQGIATLANVSLAGLRAGAFANAVTASFVGSLTYTSNSNLGLLLVAPAQISVAGITAASRVYNGTTAATLNTSAAALEGVLSGDTVTLNTSSAQGTFGTKDVGTGIAVTVSGLSLGGADAENYALTEPTVTANITPAPVDVNGVVAVSRPYNGMTSTTLDISGATLVGVVRGDNVTLDASGATGTFASQNVGTSINVAVSGLSLAGADAGNYMLTQPATTADITPADLTVTGITAASKMYDGTALATLNTSGATLMGVVSGDTVTLDTSGATGTFASPDVGTAINVTVSGLSIGGASVGNYALVEPTPTADITPAPLQVTGIIAISRVYNGMTSAPLDTTGATLQGVLQDDTVTLDTSVAAGTFASQNVGIDISVAVSGLMLAGADAGNYALTEPTLSADILPASLKVTGITADKTYDGTTAATLDTSAAMLQGVISGDTVTLDSSGATGTFASPDVGTGLTVTISGLSLGGAQAGNYILVEPTTTTANITAVILTVTGITADDKPFDGTTAATLDTSGAMLVGVVNDDTVGLDVSGAVGTFASDGPGNDIPVTILGLTLTGPEAGNYTLTQPTTTANITT